MSSCCGPSGPAATARAMTTNRPSGSVLIPHSSFMPVGQTSRLNSSALDTTVILEADIARAPNSG